MTMQLTFSTEESQVMKELLQGDLARLLLEIAHTDHRDLREYLKDRETTVENLLNKISGNA